MSKDTHISKLWNILPNKLSGMPKPEESDLQALKDNGIKAIICLLEDDSLISIYEKEGFEKLWLPIIDEHAPSFEQVEQLIKFIDEQEQKNNPVAIHCKGGRGRTGTMIASYLISKGTSYDDALDQIYAKRPNALKEHQINFLKELSSK